METQAKFTPGPWHAISAGGDGRIIGTRGEMICDCAYGPDENRIAANAALIAASPTLYGFIARLADGGNAEAKTMLDSLGLRK